MRIFLKKIPDLWNPLENKSVIKLNHRSVLGWRQKNSRRKKHQRFRLVPRYGTKWNKVCIFERKNWREIGNMGIVNASIKQLTAARFPVLLRTYCSTHRTGYRWGVDLSFRATKCSQLGVVRLAEQRRLRMATTPIHASNKLSKNTSTKEPENKYPRRNKAAETSAHVANGPAHVSYNRREKLGRMQMIDLPRRIHWSGY